MADPHSLDPVMTALADPTRRAVFEALAAGPRAVGELARELPVTRPAVSQHLRVLLDAGLVTVRADGTRRIYAAQPQGLRDLRTWLDGMWTTALHAFAAHVEATSTHPQEDR
jgi:DNA-binding transcriptional ArsR family regulator